jgi:hypothetical protein
MSEVTDIKIALNLYAGWTRYAPYWLSNDDSGATYCRKCALEALKAKPDAKLEGGCGCEGDSCEHCETCGKCLDYTLTSYGASTEIDHYSKVRFRGPLSRDEAYHLARMFDANPDDAAALKIVRRAIAKIPKGARPNRRVY